MERETSQNRMRKNKIDDRGRNFGDRCAPNLTGDQSIFQHDRASDS